MVELTKGWKGYVGAAVLMILGVLEIAQGQHQAGIALIGVGLSLLGIRHKLDYSEE